MHKDDFTNNLRTMRDSIEADYKTIETELREGKYKDRIDRENTAATTNYYQLTLVKRDPILPDPTLKDYEATANTIQGRKDQLEADLLGEIQEKFEKEDLIEKHIDAYFYDEPSKERAREHLFHPAKTEFNEKSKKAVSQIFVEQVGQKVHEERDQGLLREFQAKVNRADPSRKSEQDIQNDKLKNQDRSVSSREDMDHDTTQTTLNFDGANYPGAGSTFPSETNSSPKKGLTYTPPKDGPTIE